MRLEGFINNAQTMLRRYQTVYERTQYFLISLRQLLRGLVINRRQAPKDFLEHRQIVSTDQAEPLKQVTVGADPFKNLGHCLCDPDAKCQKIIKQPGLAQKIRHQRIRRQLLRCKIWA